MDATLDSNTASCSQCGRQLPYGSVFCAYCGTKQSQGTEPNALPHPVTPQQTDTEDPQPYPIAPPEPYVPQHYYTENPPQPNIPQQYNPYQYPQSNQNAFAVPVITADPNNIGSCAKCGTMYVGGEVVCMVCGEQRVLIPQSTTAIASTKKNAISLRIRALPLKSKAIACGAIVLAIILFAIMLTNTNRLSGRYYENGTNIYSYVEFEGNRITFSPEYLSTARGTYYLKGGKLYVDIDNSFSGIYGGHVQVGEYIYSFRKDGDSIWLNGRRYAKR